MVVADKLTQSELEAMLGSIGRVSEDEEEEEEGSEDQEPTGGGRGRPKGKKAGGGEGAEEEEAKTPFYQIAQPGPNPFNEPAPEGFKPPHGILLPDTQDEFIPTNSFIGDFVYSLKGYESPVLFNIWGAIFAMSVMTGRQSWKKFGSGQIFPNVYILWVAKPGVCKKGTALGLATELLQELPDTFTDDAYMREERSIDYISSKAPADAIFMSLKPKVRTFILPDGGVHMANFGSRTYVSASELATFLNTKKFNTGLVDTLTDLFDCKKRDRELTRTRGIEEFENFYFALGGACTPMHMETSFPPEARGGGFMSRCILVHQEFPSVWHPEPVVYDGFPDKTSLLRNFRWLAYKTRGEYDWTDEAKIEYDRWYMSWRQSLFQRGVQDDALAETRMDILTIKVATIIRMAEYRDGHDITLDNFRLARRLIAYTMSHASSISHGLGAKEKVQNYLKVRSLLQRKKVMTRKNVLTHCSSRQIYVAELAVILPQLVQEGYLKIELDGMQKYVSGTEGREVYTWTGPTAEEERVSEQNMVEVNLGGSCEKPA